MKKFSIMMATILVVASCARNRNMEDRHNEIVPIKSSKTNNTPRIDNSLGVVGI